MTKRVTSRTWHSRHSPDEANASSVSFYAQTPGKAQIVAKPIAVIDVIDDAIRQIASKLLAISGCPKGSIPQVLAELNLKSGWAPKGARTRVKGQPDQYKQPFWIEPTPNAPSGARYLSLVSFDVLATGNPVAIVSTIAHLLSVAEAAVPDPKKPGSLKFYPKGWTEVAKRFGLTGEAKAKYTLAQTPEALVGSGITDECQALAGLVAEAIQKEAKKTETFKFRLVIEGSEEVFTFRQSAKAGASLEALLKSGKSVTLSRDIEPEAPEATQVPSEPESIESEPIAQAV